MHLNYSCAYEEWRLLKGTAGAACYERRSADERPEWAARGGCIDIIEHPAESFKVPAKRRMKPMGPLDFVQLAAHLMVDALFAWLRK
jgi:hypothetical protein